MTGVKRARSKQIEESPGGLTVRRLLRMKSAPVVRSDEFPDASAILREQRAMGKGRPVVPPQRPGRAVVIRYSTKGKTFSVRVAGKQKSERRGAHRGADQSVVDRLAQTPIVRDGIAAARLGKLQWARTAAKLIDAGASDDQIAAELQIDRGGAERLRQRRTLLSKSVSPEEIILRRAVGRLTDTAMMRRLLAMTVTSSPPPFVAWFDSATSSSGTAKQLMRAYQEKLLTRDEYERLTQTVKVEAERP